MTTPAPLPECPRSVDAAPYVLGALELPDSYREHLDGCATCHAEVAELQRAADLLPAAAQPAVASRALRGRVLAQVRSEAELLRAATDQSGYRRRNRRPLRMRASTLAAAAVLAVAAVAIVVALATSGGGSTRERVTAAEVAAGSRGAHASLRQRDGVAQLAVAGMPQPPSGKIYEVWLRASGASPQPTNALFGVTKRGSADVDVPGSLHGVREVLVTSEPLGGSAHPTSTPVLRVVLPA